LRVNGEALKTWIMPPAICLRTCNGLPISTVPAAAPPMMSSSAGWSEDFDIAMLHEITAEHGPENNDDSNHGKHCGL